MDDKYLPVDRTPQTLTGPLHVLLLTWVFAALLALYSSEDLHAWLAWDDDATAVERALGASLLALGDATGAVSARRAIETRFEILREPPALFGPSVAPAPTLIRPPRAVELPDAGARRILLVGASSVEFHFGVELERCLEEFAGIEVHRVGRLGTGLARPQDLDWRAELARLQTDFRPDVVLGQFGGNDCRPVVDPESGKRWLFGTEAWDAEYQRRVEQLTDDAIQRGAQIGFLGQLAVRRPGNRRCFKRVDEVTERAVRRAGGWFLSVRGLTSSADDVVLETVSGPRGSRPRMWLSDDLHLTREGARVVASGVCAQLERRLSLENTDPAKGRILRFETPSKARARAIAWYAVMPRTIPENGVPVLYLLHGGGGGVEDWMVAQDELQRLAVKHSIALVLVDGDEWGWYADGLPNATDVETYVTRELVPEVERRLPVNGHRGIAGLSMGGHGALVLSLRNPGLFASASSMSGVVDLTWDTDRKGLARILGPYEENVDRWKDHSARHLVDRRREALRGLALMLSCGRDDRFLDVNRDLHHALERMRVPHVYSEEPGGHDWTYWIRQLPVHVAWHAEQLGGRLPE